MGTQCLGVVHLLSYVWRETVSLCQNCAKPIDTYHIKPIWYHCNTGKEQCHPEDLLDIQVAQPKDFQGYYKP